MSRSRVPRVVVGREIVPTLPLNPTEGFVLSRIDGVLSEADIGPATGLPEAVVLAAVAKLRTLNVIRFAGEPDPSEDSLRTLAAEAAERMRPQDKGASLPDEDVDLEEGHRRRIVETYSRLSIVTYYDLLGVPRDAEKKEIKRAYYELASVFHPDRFFRKKLGSYKEKMEAIFVKMTEGHDVLTSKRREEYDAQFADRGSVHPGAIRGRPVPAGSPSDARLHAVRVPVATAASEVADPTAPKMAPPSKVASAPVAPAPDPASPSRPPIAVAQIKAPASVPPRQRISGPPPSGDAKRDVLARRMLGGRPSSANIARPAGPGATPTPPDPLRQRYEQIRTRQHVLAAEDALRRGDLGAARREVAAALQLSPEDPSIKAVAEKIGKR